LILINHSLIIPLQQKVFAEAKVFKHATWIKGGFKHNTRGVVIEVNPARVEVDWVMPVSEQLMMRCTDVDV
jgi:hypothetical protein